MLYYLELLRAYEQFRLKDQDKVEIRTVGSLFVIIRISAIFLNEIKFDKFADRLQKQI